jgi:hypothetical protein
VLAAVAGNQVGRIARRVNPMNTAMPSTKMLG